MQNGIAKIHATETRSYRKQIFHRAAAMILIACLAAGRFLFAADTPAAPQTKEQGTDRGVRGAKPAVPRKPRPNWTGPPNWPSRPLPGKWLP